MKKGFTLIELMVVIVIIGILAALAIPKFLGATDRAKLAEWKTMAKEIVTLQVSYRMLHNEYWKNGNTQWWALDAPGGTVTEPADASQLGFAHPGGDSRFSYGTQGEDANLGGAELRIEIGQFDVGHQGWMDNEGSIQASGDLN